MGQESFETANEQAEPVPRKLILAFAPLHKTALGIAFGSVCGILVFVGTAVVLLAPLARPPNLGLLSQYLIGYSVSWKGAVIGLLWGGLLGFLVGWLIAFLRNLVLAFYLFLVKARAEVNQYRDFLDHI